MKRDGNKRSRHRHQQKISRKTKKLLRLNILLLILLTISGFFLWQKLNQSSKQQETAALASQQIQQTEEATSSSETKNEKINWVKQENPVKIPILMYHAIHNMNPAEAANANLIVSPEVFESHLKALQEAGYYTLTPNEAYKILTENVLPENKQVVWLTFDDSLKDFYTEAFPLMQKYQIRGTNNVITGFVEKGREDTLTLDEIKTMKEQGMSFEAHTVHHPDLSASSANLQESEMKEAKHYLDSNLSQTTSTIAYPSGRYSTVTTQIAQEAGYQMGLTTNNGLASLADGLLTLNRVRVNPTTTAQDLLNEIALP